MRGFGEHFINYAFVFVCDKFHKFNKKGRSIDSIRSIRFSVS